MLNSVLLLSTEEPELLLDANMARDHLAMLGSDITLSATIKGVPTPTISWKKDDGDVPAHITVAVTASGSKVFIPKSTRADSGNYTLTAENAVGKKSITVAVLVLSKSSAHQMWNFRLVSMLAVSIYLQASLHGSSFVQGSWHVSSSFQAR